MPDDLRAAIRSILREELAKAGADSAMSKPSVLEEKVRIESDDDLMKFVKRLLALYSDAGSRKAIEKGSHVFKLAEEGASPPEQRARRLGRPIRERETARFETGLITEKEVRNLPKSTSLVRAEKGVRVTPLALDALRRAGIKLERMTA